MSEHVMVDVDLRVPREKVEVLARALARQVLEQPREVTPSDLPEIFGQIFEVDDLEYVKSTGTLHITGTASGDMGYGTLGTVGELLSHVAEGTFDWLDDGDSSWYRWRFHEGRLSAHSSEVTFPTDTDPGPGAYRV